jgi:hypothetical protein
MIYVVVDNIWQHSPVAECWLVGHSMGEIDVGIDARVNKNLGNHYKYNHFWPKNQQKCIWWKSAAHLHMLSDSEIRWVPQIRIILWGQKPSGHGRCKDLGEIHW